MHLDDTNIDKYNYQLESLRVGLKDFNKLKLNGNYQVLEFYSYITEVHKEVLHKELLKHIKQYKKSTYVRYMI